MNRAEMREFFAEQSGRQNLTSTRLNRLLDSAAKFLAPKLSGHSTKGLVFAVLEEGYNFVDLTEYLIGVTKVFYMVDDTYTEIDKYMSWDDFIYNHSDLSETGSPGHWCLAPNLAMQNVDDYPVVFKDGELWSSSSFDGRRVLVLFDKIADEDYQLRVAGRLHIKDLESDEDENWLSLNEPYLYVLGVLYLIETQARNYENARQLGAMIDQHIRTATATGVSAEAEEMPRQIYG